MMMSFISLPDIRQNVVKGWEPFAAKADSGIVLLFCRLGYSKDDGGTKWELCHVDLGSFSLRRSQLDACGSEAAVRDFLCSQIR